MVSTRNWNATSMLIGLSRRKSNIIVGRVTLTAIASPLAPTGPSLPTILIIPVSQTTHTSRITPTGQTIPTSRAIPIDQTIPINQTTPISLTILISPATPTSLTILISQVIPTDPTARTGRVVALVVPSTLPMLLSSSRFPIALFYSTPTARSPTVESSFIRMIPIR